MILWNPIVKENNMFDKTVNVEAPGYIPVPYTKTINIGRAPTDESVKLLKEMEAAALEKLIGSVRINDNTFNVSVHILTSIQTFGYVVEVRYNINGHPLKARIDLPDSDRLVPVELVKLIHERVIESISKEISTLISIEIFNKMEFRQINI